MKRISWNILMNNKFLECELKCKQGKILNVIYKEFELKQNNFYVLITFK